MSKEGTLEEVEWEEIVEQTKTLNALSIQEEKDHFRGKERKRSGERQKKAKCQKMELWKKQNGIDVVKQTKTLNALQIQEEKDYYRRNIKLNIRRCKAKVLGKVKLKDVVEQRKAKKKTAEKKILIEIKGKYGEKN